MKKSVPLFISAAFLFSQQLLILADETLSSSSLSLSILHHHHHHSCHCRSTDATIVVVRGGAAADCGGGHENPGNENDNHDNDNDNDDSSYQRIPKSQRPPPRPNQRPYPPKQKNSKSLWNHMASQSVKLSGQALSTTARVSGKVAYNLMSNKHVEWDELVGLWRLDQWMNDENRMVQSSLEITRKQTTVLFEGKEEPCQFKAAQWPIRSARLEYLVRSNNHHLVYSCTIHRKLADKSVLKLRGKIYKKQWGGRKILLGTFVGRKRLKLKFDDGEEEDDDDDEDDIFRDGKYDDQDYDDDDHNDPMVDDDDDDWNHDNEK